MLALSLAVMYSVAIPKMCNKFPITLKSSQITETESPLFSAKNLKVYFFESAFPP